VEKNEGEYVVDSNKTYVDKPPIIECKTTVSKDGKWVIHKTIITDIKSMNYYKTFIKDVR